MFDIHKIRTCAPISKFSQVFMCHDCLWVFRSAADDANPAGAPGAPGGPGGAGPPAPPPNTTSNRRLQQTQAQVEEVTECLCVKCLWTKTIEALYMHRTECNDFYFFWNTLFLVSCLLSSVWMWSAGGGYHACECG